ncbi:hypothetical protein ACCQ08_10055 [Comamonas sp. SY3]|uniref:hypothetical protein n=1 Tax=Comamonas sp. SY3 TaxID=3243601 RepID=UPI0035942F46
MKLEKQYFWKIQVFGKWKTTRFRCTEEHIKDEHPEAICIPGSLVELSVPETEEEMWERYRTSSTGNALMNHLPSISQTEPPEAPPTHGLKSSTGIPADLLASLEKEIPF